LRPKRLDGGDEGTLLAGHEPPVSYDVSRFLDASIHEVPRTLAEYVSLVFGGVYLLRLALDAHSGATAPVALIARWRLAAWRLFVEPVHALRAGTSASWSTTPLW
jgi:hypothetical protein